MIDKTKKILKMSVSLLKYYYYSIECFITKRDNSQVWLISERGVDARDNGYWLYRYVRDNYPEINVKYVISRESADRKKILKGDIVNYGSREHFLLFKTAGLLISTHIMGYSPEMSLFSRMDKRGLLRLKGKKVFLQHGITCAFHPLLNKDSTNLDLFVTCSEQECNFIKENNGYDDKVVKCTGFCRYDHLIDDSTATCKRILIMPTFRKWLNYVNDFVATDYYKHWSGLLNDDGFIHYVESNNIEVLFYPHYEIQRRLDCFSSRSKNIVICSFDEYDVQDLLRKANVLITDYSSVQFDFAYMNKKVIYYQFDEKRFYEEHYKKGYFDFRKMGFGKVCIDIREVIDDLTTSLAKVYLMRRKSFFRYHDNENSKRVFNEIQELINEEQAR